MQVKDKQMRMQLKQEAAWPQELMQTAINQNMDSRCKQVLL
jgi:hypothetical protein